MTGSGDDTLRRGIMRLAEADALLQSLLSGQIDAVIDAETGHSFLLHSTQLAMAKSVARFRSLVHEVPAIICEVGLNGEILFVNEALTAVSGYLPHELVGLPWWSLLWERDPTGGPPALWQRILDGIELEGELDFAAKNGELRTLEWKSTRLFKSTGELDHILTIALDITHKKQIGHRLKQAEFGLRLFASVFEQAAEGVLITDSTGKILAGNRASWSATGYLEDELQGVPISILHGADGEFGTTSVFEAVRAGINWQGESILRRKNGETFPVWASAQAIKGQEQEADYKAVVFSDITRLKQNEETIKHMAYHDSLTNLPNRQLFRERLAQELAYASRLSQMTAVMYLDLDRMKRINDTLGHTLGDQLLQKVTQRLLNCVRAGDLIARMGGDEFTILLPRISSENAPARVAEKIQGVLSQPFHLGGRTVALTASIGIAFYPSDGTDPETLLTSADTAMYRAKERGRNNYQVYTPAMNERVTERLTLESDLRKALEQNQLEVWYQPQIQTQQRKVVGFEALLRWRHPERGLIPPDRFIPLAEESWLILPIGEWVLRQACTQVTRWSAMGLGRYRIGVNLSPLQFQQSDLVGQVRSILTETECDPTLVEFEITEGSMVQDVSGAIQVMQDLRGLGVQFALDDYGTGYSSLSHLKRFPIQRLKIAQEFMHDLTESSHSASIVRSVLSLARNLQMDVIAEGVETPGQYQFLRRHRCVEMQGYLFSKPLPAGAIEAFLRSPETGAW